MSELDRARFGLKTAFAVLMLAAVLLAGCGEDEEPTAGDAAPAVTTATTATTATTTTATATTPTQTIDDAQAAIDDDDYSQALAIAAVLTVAEANAVRRRISNRIARRAQFALRNGDRRRAQRLLRQADKYPATALTRQARTDYRAAKQRAAERARQRRLAAEQRRQERAAQRAAARERRQQREQNQNPAPSVPSGTCSQIPQTDFPVPPGDPRDRDGDGIACES